MDYSGLKKDIEKMIAICLTPMTNEEAIDYAALQAHLEFMLRGGLTSDNSMMIIGGSTAEAHSMTIKERKQMLESAMEVLGGKVPVVVGCQHGSINETIDLMKHAKQAGAACTMVTIPFYYVSTDEAIVNFYEKLSMASDMGIVLYNNIGGTGRDLPIELLHRLTENPNIVGIKECTFDFIKMERAARELGEKISVINGHGLMYEPFAAIAGTTTFNSSESCFAPALAVEAWEARRSGDFALEKQIRDRLIPYFNLLSEVAAKGGPNAVISLIKYATDAVGSYMGPGRTPVCPTSDEIKGRLAQALRDAQLI